MFSKIKLVDLPRKPEIEQRLLSGICYLANPKDLRIQNAMLVLDEQCFFEHRHKQIYNLIDKMFKNGEDLSLVNLLSVLPEDLYFFADNTIREEYYTGNYLEHDVQQLVDLSTWRKQLSIMTEAINESGEGITPQDSLQIIASHLQRVTATVANKNNTYTQTYEDLADEILSNNNETDAHFPVNMPGLPWVPNRALITIAGRSGHGKTFFAMYLMDCIINAKPNKQVMYFNLEMHPQVMIERHARLLGYTGKTRRELINQAAAELLSKNVNLVSKPMITIDEIEAQSRLAALKKPLSVIVVDYLGLIKSKTKSERKDLEQADIAKRLAALSIELDCVVIALIQVNRDFKNKQVGDRCPYPQDSAESMGSVHSSTWWIGIDQPQNDDSSLEWQDMFQVCCRKNRGESGNFNLVLKFKHGMFSKWEKPLQTFNYRQKSARPDGF